MVWTLAASFGVGPNAACSRKRRAAAAETCALGIPIWTANGAEVELPVLHGEARLAGLRGETGHVERSGSVRGPEGDAVQHRDRGGLETCTGDRGAKNTERQLAIGADAGDDGVGGIRVTMACAVPFGPVADTVSLPEAGMAAGAVYRPAEVTVPETCGPSSRAGGSELLGRAEAQRESWQGRLSVDSAPATSPWPRPSRRDP